MLDNLFTSFIAENYGIYWLYFSLSLFVCVCVCVNPERQSERESERERFFINYVLC